MADERSRAIDLALSQIEKQFGKGSIMRLGNKEAIVPISVIPTGAISFGKYEQIVPLRRTKPVNVHVFGNQSVETKVYLMLPADADEVKVDGCGVFEGMLTRPDESWIDTQVEHSDKSNEF